MKYVLIVLVISFLSSCMEGTDAQIIVLDETCSEYEIIAKYLNSSDIQVQCRCKSSGYLFESDIECILGECRWAYGNKCDDGKKDTVYMQTKPKIKIEIQHDTIYINKKIQPKVKQEYDGWLPHEEIM